MANLTKRAPTIGGAPTARPTILDRGMKLLTAGHAPVKHEWIHHRFGLTAIGLVVSGRGTYQVDDGPIIPIEAGTCFAVWPGPVFHYGATDGTEPTPARPGGISNVSWDEFHICVDGPAVKRLVSAGLLWQDPRVFRISHLAQHAHRFGELIGVLRTSGPGDIDRAQLLAERILLELFLSRNTGSESREPSPAVCAALDHCRAHFAEPVDWRALARKHAMSYSLLRQRVREITGFPPARFVNQLRCDQARALLSDSSLPVKEIADRVGIADPYEFSRVFKRCAGVSPREYRKRSAPWRMGTVLP